MHTLPPSFIFSLYMLDEKFKHNKTFCFIYYGLFFFFLIWIITVLLEKSAHIRQYPDRFFTVSEIRLTNLTSLPSFLQTIHYWCPLFLGFKATKTTIFKIFVMAALSLHVYWFSFYSRTSTRTTSSKYSKHFQTFN